MAFGYSFKENPVKQNQSPEGVRRPDGQTELQRLRGATAAVARKNRMRDGNKKERKYRKKMVKATLDNATKSIA